MMAEKDSEDPARKRSLIAFAFLAQAKAGETDLLSGLSPIFKPIAKANQGKKFVPEDFARQVGELYGLRIHPWAIEDFAPRLERGGVLQKVQISTHVHEFVYAPVQEEFAAVSEADIANLLGSFRQFARPLLHQNQESVPDTELDEAFLRQFRDMNFLEALLRPDRPDDGNGRQRKLRLPKSKEQLAWETENEKAARLQVLCASFILHLHRTDTASYQLLLSIGSGALVSEVILDCQAPAISKQLDGLVVVLDAPFLMSLLDLSSEESHEFASAVCEELRTHSAQVVTFRHCLDELGDNLRAVVSRVREGTGFGATARRLNSGAFAAYANSILADPEKRLATAGIRVIEIPETSRTFQFFTDQDEKELFDALGYYENPLAQERDAASIASIVRLRKGQRSRMAGITAIGHIFVTENQFVVRRATRFLADKQLFRPGEVPPAITDRYLAGLLWVMYGGKAADLAPKLLLANCAAALEPRSDLIAKMLRFLHEVSPEQEKHFTALMTDERAGQHLMQLTLGDSQFLTRDNAVAILEDVKASLIEEHRTKASMEIDELRRAHDAAIRERQESNHQLTEQLLGASIRESELSSSLQRMKAQMSETKALLATSVEEGRRQKLEQINAVMRRVGRYRTLMEIGLSVAFASASGLLAWVASLSLSSLASVAIGVATGGLALLGFWKLPSRLFDPWLDEWCLNVLETNLIELGIFGVRTDYHLDWDTQTARYKA